MDSIGRPDQGRRQVDSPPLPSAGRPQTPAGLDITHRRNRLAGMWAAELLGLIGQAASDYARSVMHPDHPQEQIHGDDQEEVVGKLSTDLDGRATMGEIRDKMAHFLSEAKRQILHEKRD